MEHVKNFQAINHRCKQCKIVGNLESCCNQKFPQHGKEKFQRLKARDKTHQKQRVIGISICQTGSGRRVGIEGDSVGHSERQRKINDVIG